MQSCIQDPRSVRKLCKSLGGSLLKSLQTLCKVGDSHLQSLQTLCKVLSGGRPIIVQRAGTGGEGYQVISGLGRGAWACQMVGRDLEKAIKESAHAHAHAPAPAE